MTTILEEDKLLMQVESIKHMTKEEINELLLNVDTNKYIGYRILFILSLIKVGDWSYEEGLEEIERIGKTITEK